MTLLDALHIAITSIRASGMKAVLTVMGLGIGAGAVMTVLLLSDAGEIRVEEEIAKLGVNKVWIRSAGDQTLMSHDAAAVKKVTNAPGCASSYSVAVVAMGDKTATVQAAGFDYQFEDVFAPVLLSGRCINEYEFHKGSPVGLVDETLAAYFKNDILGRYISVGNRKLRIVGIIESMAMQAMSGGNGLLVLPLQTFFDTFGGEVSEITLLIQPDQSPEEIAAIALEALPGRGEFRTDTLEKEINAAREIVRIFITILLCVAGLSVLTGGIGIMNILLISVRERRREIGLIKAVGGTSFNVALLFLTEAVCYTMAGGVTGMLVSFAFSKGSAAWIGLRAKISWPMVFAVLTGEIVLGLCFGGLPAIKAASMQPIDALNCE